jgi:hypothetical protein
MKIFITKFALTRGIIEVEGEFATTSPNVISYKTESYKTLLHKPYWYLTKEEAVVHAEALREKKITSLGNQMKKIRKIEF